MSLNDMLNGMLILDGTQKLKMFTLQPKDGKFQDSCRVRVS